VKCTRGFTAKIYHDYDCDQPWSGDDGVRIVVLARNSIDPSKGACGRDPVEVMAWAKANAREWYVTNLFKYEHSGVAYRAGEFNPFGCPWDSGQVGIVALKKSEWGRGKGERNAKRLAYAKNVAEEYGRWANGETYGYTLHDPDGNEVDSCWGFIGRENVEAEAKDVAIAAADNADRQRVKRLKTMIRNRVPLERRV
jgi:hypothetical protein